MVGTLVSILNLENNAHVEKKCIQDTSLDILAIIVKYSPVPLSNLLVNTAFPATGQFDAIFILIP